MTDPLPSSNGSRKLRVNITLDPGVYADAQGLGLNISGLCNDTLRSIAAAIVKGETEVHLNLHQRVAYEVTTDVE